MNILFLNASIPNYLIDGLFHGLRSLTDITVVDVPRMDYMYEDASVEDLQKTGSRGNTLYKILPEEKQIRGKRTYWLADIEKYDHIIFTDIFEQCDLFNYIYKSLSKEKRSRISIIDGYDSSSRFPFFHNSFNLKVRPWSYFYNFNNVNVFKREFENTGELYGIRKGSFPVLNKIASKILSIPSRQYKISMSIPESHIENISFKNKTQDFVNYNIDDELNEIFNELPVAEAGVWKPSFEKQEDYYNDIKKSKFGITTRRLGWDCLRHYEYAAKGAILCFKNLEEKNEICAPFGLDETNCIPYTTKDDLLYKIKSKTIGELEEIQKNQYEWIRRYTTKNVAKDFLLHLSNIREVPKRTVVDFRFW